MRLDDATLDGHLARRARAATADTLVESVMARVGQVEQPAAWRWWLADRVSTVGAVGLVAVVAIVVGIAVAALPADPGASTAPGPIVGYPDGRPLIADELVRLIGATPPGIPGFGEHVVADVRIVREADPTCDGTTAIPCPTGYLAGVEPRVPVTESIALLVDHELSPPFLFQLRPEWPGSLFVVGEVASAPDRLTWTLPALIEHRQGLDTGSRPPSEVFLVDAWLVQTDAAYRCVAPAEPVVARYACGAAAWLSPVAGRASEAPAAGLRVQNAALQLFGRGPAPRRPERAIFAVALEDAPNCFQCPPAGAARIVARIDPIEATPDGAAATPVLGSTGPDPTLSPQDLELEAAPPDSAFDAAATGSIVGSARKATIFLEPPVLTHRLVAALVRRDETSGGAVVDFHDYEGGGVVVADMVERLDGWVSSGVRHDTAPPTLSTWETARLEAAVRSDPSTSAVIVTISRIADLAPVACGTHGSRRGFCFSATVEGSDAAGRSTRHGVVVDLLDRTVLSTVQLVE